MVYTDPWGEEGGEPDPNADLMQAYKDNIWFPPGNGQSGNWVPRADVENNTDQYLRSLVTDSKMSPSQAAAYLGQRGISISVGGGGPGSMFALEAGTALAEKPVKATAAATIGFVEFATGTEAATLLEGGSVAASGQLAAKLGIGEKIIAPIIRYGIRPAANAVTGVLFDLEQDMKEGKQQSLAHYAKRFAMWFGISEAIGMSPKAMELVSKVKSSPKVAAALEKVGMAAGPKAQKAEVLIEKELASSGGGPGAARASGPEFANGATYEKAALSTDSKVGEAVRPSVSELRQQYLQKIDEYGQEAKSMVAQGHTAEEAVRKYSPMRNTLKAEVRERGPWLLARLADVRNILVYGNKLGPTADQLFRQYGSWETALEKISSSNRTIDWLAGAKK
jgi:hypothetical protein